MRTRVFFLENVHKRCNIDFNFLISYVTCILAHDVDADNIWTLEIAFL